MKKFYLTIALFSGAISIFAQQPINGFHSTNVTMQPKAINQDRAVGYYYLDYEGYDYDIAQSFGQTVESGAYFFNRRNPVYFPTTTLGMGDAYVVFDTMVVTPDYTAGSFIPFSNNVVQSFLIDTAYARVYHENNSTTADTVVLLIKNVSATGTPGTTILWGDTIITATSLTTPNTGNTYPYVTMRFPVNYNVPAGGKFTLEIMYYGASQDTFGLIATNTTTGVACTNAPAGNEIVPSSVLPSAFYKYWNASVISAVVPSGTAVGGLYIDCDGDGAAGLPADWPQEQAIQTYSIWVSGTLTDNTGIDEEIAGVKVTAYPNPAKDFTTIEYTLIKDANVSVSITDLSGKVAYYNNLGKRDAGTSNIMVNTSELSNGLYIYTVTVDNNKVNRRILVNK